MEREIKFRVWDGKKIIYADEYWITESGWVAINRIKGIAVSETDNLNGVLMQFTGLKDRNGKEIYEFCEINNKYIVVYKFNRYILQNISNRDIFAEINENEQYEITREYSPLA